MNRACFAVLAASTACAGPFEPPPLIEAGSPIFPLPEPAVVAAPPTATATMALSVEEAILLALSNNHDLRVQQLAPIIAGTFEQIERGVFDPELFAEGTFNYEQATQTARATGEQFDVEGTATDARVGIRQRFSTGTDVEATVEHRLDDSNRTPEQQIARVGITITQALLRGLGPAVNLVGIEQAALEAEASLFQLRAFAEALLADCETAYWQYVLAQEEIRIFENALSVAQQERSQIQARIEVGELPELEIAAARVEEARRQQALIDARRRLEAARLRLNRLVNPDPSGRLDTALTTTSDPRVDPAPISDREARTQLAEKFRPDLAEARLRLRQNRLEIVATRNGLLPRLDAFVTLRKTGFADAFPTAFDRLGAENTYDIVAGLSLSQPLLNRAASASNRAAQTSRRQAEGAVRNLEQQARLEVRLALNELDRAQAQIRASTETRRLQERAVFAVKERFQVGAGTALLVAQAQRDLLENQIAEVRAVVDYRRALIELYRAEGTLLARRGISVAAPPR